MSETGEDLANFRRAMKRTSVKPKPKPRSRKYITSGGDRRAGIIGSKCSLAEAIYKAND